MSEHQMRKICTHKSLQHSIIHGHKMSLLEGTSDQRSGWPEDLTKMSPDPMPHLLGVHHIKGQPDLKIWHKYQPDQRLMYRGTSDQWSAWPKDLTKISTWLEATPTGEYIWPKVSLAWRSDKNVNLTKNVTMGVHLTKGNTDPKIWQNVNLTRCLTYGGLLWLKVSLTQRVDINVNLAQNVIMGGTSDQKSS